MVKIRQFLLLFVALIALCSSTACGGPAQAGSKPTASHQAPAKAQIAKGEKHAPAKPIAIPATIKLPHGGKATLKRQNVGKDGALPIPNTLNQAAWWGAPINGHGAMLLSGHINWKGKVGPFNELWQSKRGDMVTIGDKKGVKHKYRVQDITTLTKEKLPKYAPKLFAQTGPSRLVLVTCGGEFVGGEKGYDENRIVIANPV